MKHFFHLGTRKGKIKKVKTKTERGEKYMDENGISAFVKMIRDSSSETHACLVGPFWYSYSLGLALFMYL